MYEFLYSMLIVGEKKYFTIGDPIVELSSMYGYIKNAGYGENSYGIYTTGIGSGYAAISNRIFEIWLSNYFISRDSNISRIENAVCGSLYKEIVNDGTFNMALCLQKFAEHYFEIYADVDIPFLERHGRLLFISFLRPLINGRGFYHIESQFTDLKRMDIVVDFERSQFIIELKRWKGEIGNEKAYEQLLDYMNSKNADKGYLLTFDFRKEKNKERKAEWVHAGEKRIFAVVV